MSWWSGWVISMGAGTGIFLLGVFVMGFFMSLEFWSYESNPNLFGLLGIKKSIVVKIK